MTICCDGVKNALESAAKNGYGLSYAEAVEPPMTGLPIFFIEYGNANSSQIQFCPWCGTKLS